MLIIFDLDDTLVDTSACITPVKFQRSLSRMIEEGLVLQDEKLALAALLDLDKTSLSAKETFRKFFLMYEVLDQFHSVGLKEMYDTLPEGIEIHPVMGAVEVISNLCLENKLALVTIGKHDQQLFKMEKAGIDSSFFCKIFISEEYDKKKYYEQIIDDLGLVAGEVIVCGDRIATDLVPAKELGCVTVHMKWGRGARKQEQEKQVDFTITSLAQVLDVVNQVKEKIIFNGVQ